MEILKGFKISANVFQHEMWKLFEDLQYLLVYLDDLLVRKKATYKDHPERPRVVFNHLWKKKVQLNVKKSSLSLKKLNT